jgi:hypothetical protein
LRFTECVSWDGCSFSLRASEIGEEFSGVLVTIINSDRPSADTNVKTNLEISGLEWLLRAVLLNDDLSFKEGSLGSSGVNLLGFGDHN